MKKTKTVSYSLKNVWYTTSETVPINTFSGFNRTLSTSSLSWPSSSQNSTPRIGWHRPLFGQPYSICNMVYFDCPRNTFFQTNPLESTYFLKMISLKPKTITSIVAHFRKQMYPIDSMFHHCNKLSFHTFS